MKTVPLSTAKAKLSELVDEAVTTQEHVTITRNGTPAVVLISSSEWESIQETLFWQTQPGLADDIHQGRAEYSRGEIYDETAVRARYGLPPQ